MATVRIGTFNVENLFERPRAMAGPLTAGNAVLAAHARVNALIAEERYDPDVRAEILEHLETLGLLRADAAALALLRQVRGGSCAAPGRRPPGPPARRWSRPGGATGSAGSTSSGPDRRARDGAHGARRGRRRRGRPRGRRGREPRRAQALHRRGRHPPGARSTRTSWSSTATTTAGSTSAAHPATVRDRDRALPRRRPGLARPTRLRPRLPRVRRHAARRRHAHRARQPLQVQGVRDAGRVGRDPAPPGDPHRGDLRRPARPRRGARRGRRRPQRHPGVGAAAPAPRGPTCAT